MEKLTDKHKEVLKEMVEYRCQICKNVFTSNQLEIHRIKRGEHGGKYEPNNILVLCSECHNMIT